MSEPCDRPFKRRLALVARGNVEGSWMSPKGNEYGIAVEGLTEGEQVHLSVDDGESLTTITCITDVLLLYPLHSVKRFKVAKCQSKSARQTIIEVCLNGTPHSNNY